MSSGAGLRCAGLILAAGESRRMGQPKALLELDGRSFLARGVELLRAGGCARVLVIDGAHRLDPERVAELGAELVHNSRWTLGPLSSLHAGLDALTISGSEPPDVLVVHHVERPRVQAETLHRLLAAMAEAPACLWQPSYGGRSGHPMLWPRGLFGALRGLDPRQDTARTLVRGAAAQLRRKLEVEDAGVLDNIDTPAELAALRGSPGDASV